MDSCCLDICSRQDQIKSSHCVLASILSWQSHPRSAGLLIRCDHVTGPVGKAWKGKDQSTKDRGWIPDPHHAAPVGEDGALRAEGGGGIELTWAQLSRVTELMDCSVSRL